MNIALFVETYAPYINGVATHVKLLKQNFERLGHKVLVVTASPNHRHHTVIDDVLYCPAKPMKRLYGFGLASPVSRTRTQILQAFNPDVIHIHQEFGVGFFGLKMGKLLNVPVIYTMHTMYDEYLHYISPVAQVMPITKELVHKYSKYFGKSADVIVGPSDKVVDYFRVCGVRKKVIVMPNGVNTDEYGEDNINRDLVKKVKARCGIPEGKTVACFAGRLAKEKSIDMLLSYWTENFKNSDDLHLLIIGDGPVKPELEAQAKKLNIYSNVTFAGAQPHNEMPAYYAQCDAFVTLSLTEMHSISMLEAMASGLVILQRRDVRNSGQIEEGVNGYLYDDSAQFGKILRSVASLSQEQKRDLRHQVSNSARRYGTAELAKKLIDVYSGAIERHIK